MSSSSLPNIGSLSAAMDKDTLGAAVVSKTLDTLNNAGGVTYAPTDKQTFGAAVVSKTLDYMNSGAMGGQDGGMSQTYGFAKDVLGAYMSGRGAIADIQT